ncbi:MAG TPA: long-chain fatty acid--CoA ligase, partial [Acidimicrobiia bacterium]|nr:long-chain fatty acid--CoA ligase [Acidimicrobiia bacterium]
MPEWGDLQEDQLRFMARSIPDRLAYRNLDAGTSLTFAEWDAQSNRLARGLLELGVTKGDRVSIFLPSDEVLRWIVAYAAVHKAGAVVVPTNTRLSNPELVSILGHAEIVVSLTSEELLPTAIAVQPEIPSFRTIVSSGTWDDVLDDDASDIQVPVALTDLADVMYTSGTTGLPKGIAVRHDNAAMIPNHEPRWTGGGWLHGAPMFTFAGIAFIYNPMKMGLTALYHPKFDAGRWLRYVETERPTHTMLVPAFAELIVAHPDFATADLSSLVQVSIGSAPIAPKTHQILIERVPHANVGNSFGMSEAGPAYIVMPPEEIPKRIGSVGKPIGPMEIRIIDDQDVDLPPSDVGELLMRMQGKQREYYKDDAATASTWTPDGWLRTGDLAYLDEDGYLYICG